MSESKLTNSEAKKFSHAEIIKKIRNINILNSNQLNWTFEKAQKNPDRKQLTELLKFIANRGGVLVVKIAPADSQSNLKSLLVSKQRASALKQVLSVYHVSKIIYFVPELATNQIKIHWRKANDGGKNG